MTLTLHNLRSPRGAKKSRKRLGRGNASGHGSFSTRGQKGQRARSGGRKRLVQRGVKHFIMRIPKQRGFTSLNTKPEIIDVKKLNIIPEGTVVDAKVLKSLNLTKTSAVKIIGSKGLKKKLIIKLSHVSRGARAAITAAGGKIESDIQVEVKQDK